MANITYRATLSPSIPIETTLKAAPLTNVEVDANFKSLNDDIDTRVISTRTITINGTAQDLSLNRAWSVGTVTSVAGGTGLTGTVTNSGSINLEGQALALHNLSTNGIIARTSTGAVASRTITASTGVSIANGDGVSGNPTISVLYGTTSTTACVGNDARLATNLTATAGTTAGPTINSSTGDNVVIPSASATNSGIVTTGTQTFAGVKTFSSTITGSISGNAATATSAGSCTGNAATATKLATARTIGGTSFDGTANINLPGVNIAGNQNTTGNAENIVTPTGSYKHVGAWGVGRLDAGAILVNTAYTADSAGICTGNAATATNADMVDGQHFTYSNSDNNPTYLWGTNSDGSSILAHRASISVNYANVSGSCSGNAATATSLQTARTIGGVSFNGSTDITVASATNNFDVTGDLTATGNITAYFSDDRLKTNLGNIEGALDKVNSLNGFYYKANDVANNYGYTSEYIEVGVSAQQVKEILPQVIHPAPFDVSEDGSSKSGENYMTVQYERMVPLLIEAIKELTARLEKLEK